MSLVGILGGTFNPVHNGHLQMAASAATHFALDRVLMIPTNMPPHKEVTGHVSAGHRLAMLRLATASNPLLAVDTIEIDRGGISYTIDTLRQLRQRQPGDDFFFIIGVDSLLQLHTWREPEQIVANCRIVTIYRPGVLKRPLQLEDIKLPLPLARQLLDNVITDTLNETSSSLVRSRIAKQLPISYHVPLVVEEYIKRHGLYRQGGQINPLKQPH